jgi:hypothetical protein
MDESGRGQKLPRSATVELHDLPKNLHEAAARGEPARKVGSEVRRSGFLKPESDSHVGTKRRRSIPSALEGNSQ